MGARLFVAVWPPAPLLDAVAALDRPAVPGLRWTGREQWHVTLRFLGAVEDVAAVVAGLAVAGLSSFGAVEAVVGPDVGRFGNRVLHVPVGGLAGLAAAVEACTAGFGRAPEDREFAGHLTLARVAKGARVDLRRLAGQPVPGGSGSTRWTVREVCLVESHLAPSGARYEVLEVFSLSG